MTVRAGTGGDGLFCRLSLYLMGNSVTWRKGMDVVANATQCIEGQKLTSWSVIPGGEQVCLGFAARDGEIHRILLPVDTLTGLLMTLPRILQSALDERFPDGTLRIVHPLGL